MKENYAWEDFINLGIYRVSHETCTLFCCGLFLFSSYGPLTRYVKFWVVHAPEMPGKFSPPPWVSDPDMHHGTCMTHGQRCIPGSLTSGFIWSCWRRKRSGHSRCMRNQQFYVSGKRPMRIVVPGAGIKGRNKWLHPTLQKHKTHQSQTVSIFRTM